jgi:hypothetical protein
VWNSIFFNNVDDYVRAAQVFGSMLLGLGPDCEVFIVQRHTMVLSLIVKMAVQRTAWNQRAEGLIRPTSILTLKRRAYDREISIPIDTPFCNLIS